MCDICDCKSFSPHLWKAGECRDCHHPIGHHLLVPVEDSVTLLSNSAELAQKHVVIGKLTVDKLEPFIRPPEESNPLTSSGSVGRVRTSITLTPAGDDQVVRRLSANFRLSREISTQDGGTSVNNMRRSPSFKSAQMTISEEGEPTTTYEQRLSASYRKSREIIAKRKSVSEGSGEKIDSTEHRMLAIEELVVTERDYCRDLDYLIQVL
jgi:hypothetical protein